VNPDHYKVAGRERQGEDVVHREERQAFQADRPERRPRPPSRKTGKKR
jgi:hypothetical protein